MVLRETIYFFKMSKFVILQKTVLVTELRSLISLILVYYNLIFLIHQSKLYRHTSSNDQSKHIK